jgi:chromate transporter
MQIPLEHTGEPAQPLFAEAVGFWWKLGWISFGGTAAHIAIMHGFLVEKKKWISNSHFLHALSLCMLLPGPEAQQLAIYIGWKLHGKKGGIVAGSLFVLPSMFVLLVLSIIYVRFGNLPWIVAIFGGLKPAVIALVILALIRVARRALVKPLQWIVALGSFIAMASLHVPIPVEMLVVVLLGVLVVWGCSGLLASRPAVETARGSVGARELRWEEVLRSTIKIVGTAFLLWLAPFLSLYWFGHHFSFWRQLSLFFTRTAFVTIGGSYTVIPYVAQVAVMKYHWLTQAQTLDGFALAETTPGPLIIVVAFVGFMAGFNYFHGSVAMGTLALLVTTFYTFLPCFLLVFAGAPLVERTEGKRGIQAILRLITAVVVAAMLDLTGLLGRGVLFPAGKLCLAGLNWISLTWIGVSLLLLRAFKLNMVAVIGLSLIVGIARWFIHIT